VKRIDTARQEEGASILINKEVKLFVEDGDRTFPRDGILRSFDNTHYYVEMLVGPKTGEIIGFLKTTVRRIEPLMRSGGVSHG